MRTQLLSLGVAGKIVRLMFNDMVKVQMIDAVQIWSSQLSSNTITASPPNAARKLRQDLKLKRAQAIAEAEEAENAN